MAKKFKATPRGVFVFPRINGEADTKFDPDGRFSVKLRLDAAKAAPLIAEIDAAMEANFAEQKKAADSPMKAKKLKMADAPYTEDEDGTFLFTFGMKHRVTRKDKTTFVQKPAVIDATLKPVGDSVKIGGGTEGKVSYDLNPYCVKSECGVSLRLIGAQILKLVEWGGRSAASMGFEEEEGGWGAEDSDESTTSAATADDSSEDETEDASASSGKESDDF